MLAAVSTAEGHTTLRYKTIWFWDKKTSCSVTKRSRK